MKIAQNLFKYFIETGTSIKYYPGDIIYMEEDNSNNLYLILKGRVRVFLVSKDGQEITLDIISKGGIFGESSFLQNTNQPLKVYLNNEVSVPENSIYHFRPLNLKIIKYMSARSL